MIYSELPTTLIDSQSQRRTKEHPFLLRLRQRPISRRGLELVLGQYWYPIHHFTTFLAQCVVIVKELDVRSRVAFILDQELGRGDAGKAHEALFLRAAQQAGIPTERVRDAQPLATTTALIAGYTNAAQAHASALGFLYATEVIDLALVTSLGSALRQASGGARSEWEEVHGREEPDHVTNATGAVGVLQAAELKEVTTTAEHAWDLWGLFFDRIGVEVAES